MKSSGRYTNDFDEMVADYATFRAIEGKLKEIAEDYDGFEDVIKVVKNEADNIKAHLKEGEFK